MNDPSPAMCLICGQIVCALSKCCSESYFGENKVGGATAHALRCSQGIGLFMIIRSTGDYFQRYERSYQSCSGVMIIMRGGRICNTQFNLPYLDQHGEPDPGLKRGNQLLLSESAYENIRKQWIGHEFAERVSRAQSSNRHYYGNNQWDQF